MLSTSPRRVICTLLMALMLSISFTPKPATAQLSVRWDPFKDPGVGGWSVCSEISPFDSRTILVGGDILGTNLSNDAGWNWQQCTGFADWELGDFTWHPTTSTTVWAGTLGGCYQSTNGGLTWTSQRAGFPTATSNSCSAPIQKVCFDPNNSSTLLAFGGNQRNFITPLNGTTCYGAVWKSTNSGANWTKIATLTPTDSTGITGPNIHNAGFAAGSSSIVFACTSYGGSGVYKSVNGGTTWAAANTGLPSGANVLNMVLHPTNPLIAWVSLDNGGNIYTTTNGGTSWVSSSTGIDTSTGSSQYIQALAVSKSNPMVLYCGAQTQGSSSGNSTYISTNGGANWTAIVTNGNNSVVNGGVTNSTDPVIFKFLSVDPNDPTHVMGNTEGLLLESWNSGTTWYDVASFNANGHKRGTGATGLCPTIVKWNPHLLGQMFPLANDDGKLLRSTDFGYSFTEGFGSLGPYNGAFDVGFGSTSSQLIYLGTGQAGNPTNEAILKGTGWGTNWAYISRPTGVTGDNRGIYVDPTDTTGNTVYSIVSNINFSSPTGGLYKTTNGGTSWSTLFSGNSILFTITADPVNYHTIYVAGQAGIYKSTDGTTFSLMSGSPTTTLWSHVHIDPTNSSILDVAALRVGQVQRYSGGAWSQIFAKYSANDIAVDPNNNQRMAVCTHGYPSVDLNLADGVWITTNGGTNWTQYNTGLRLLSAFTIAFNPDHSGQLLLGTDGAGWYATDLGTSTPYGGTTPSVVGTIQAEAYDIGGQNVAYYDTTPGNQGGDMIRTDDVDIKAEGTGHAVCNMVASEWLKYSVSVPTTGYYDITLHCMSTTSTPQYHVEFNGVNVTGPILVGNTSGAWKDVAVRGVRLTAGTQYMKLYVEGSGGDVDYISTAASTTGITVNNPTASGKTYTLNMSSLGATAFIDRSYILSTLTTTLRNIPMIQTAMGDNATTNTSLVSFTLDKPGTVYVALDKRLTTLPAFLSGWTLTSESADINTTGSIGYNVYSNHFAAGTVTLGGNIESPASGYAIMYMVFIRRD